MFLPENVDKKDSKERERRAVIEGIEKMAAGLIPEPLTKPNPPDISVREVQCGDPSCAPVDTIVTILFESGGRGMFGLPMEARDVMLEDMKELFPTPDVLEKWHQGKDADWPPEPPYDYDDYDDEGAAAVVQQVLPTLRFQIGQRVLCRIGPDPVTGWAPGIVMWLWYREPHWPSNSWAPYQILLDDGREIYAPADFDQVIKKVPDEVVAASE